MAIRSIPLKSFINWLSIFLLSFLIPSLYFANYSNFYSSQYLRYGVYDEFNDIGIENEVVNQRLDEVIRYSNSRKKFLDSSFFSYEDIEHLRDVRNILIIFYIAVWLFITLFILTKQRLDNVTLTNFKRYSFYSIILLWAITLPSYIYFDQVFYLAHELVFTNDYWLLNPKTSNLIKLFPQDLFFQVFLFVFGFVILIQSLILLLSYYKLKSINE